EADMAMLNRYPDSASISDWAREAVAMMTQYDLMNGNNFRSIIIPTCIKASVAKAESIISFIARFLLSFWYQQSIYLNRVLPQQKSLGEDLIKLHK
ncbi:hypothetical protein, partial [uncultured Peptoniphilus sp.]|uniref:hypothetical protein n=1 Tax=uncultured Peptoniphilus sp. TaxID=254354 RepID=UPI0028064706